MHKFALPILFSLYSCSAHHPTEAENYTGTYAREATDRLGSLADTLFITMPKEMEGRLFLVVKKSAVTNLDDNGAALPPVKRQVRLTAAYNAGAGTLTINETGEQYVLLAGDTTLSNGYLTYTRLK